MSLTVTHGFTERTSDAGKTEPTLRLRLRIPPTSAKAHPISEVSPRPPAIDEDNVSILTPNSSPKGSNKTDTYQQSGIPPFDKFECNQPSVITSEFSEPTEYLNNVSSKNFFKRRSFLNEKQLKKKSSMFEKFQDLDFSHGSNQYTDQYLAIMVSNYEFDTICGRNRKDFLKPLQDFFAIKKVILIPRSKVGMAYRIDNLGRQYHGTVIKGHSSFKTFLSIFDHVPIQRIHYESKGFVDNKSGINIKSSVNDSEVEKLSARLW